jgi:hypothetical protein
VLDEHDCALEVTRTRCAPKLDHCIPGGLVISEHGGCSLNRPVDLVEDSSHGNDCFGCTTCDGDLGFG